MEIGCRRAHGLGNEEARRNGSGIPPRTSRWCCNTWGTPRTRPRPSWARPRTRLALVNLPFREEYPGGRQWNLDAAQFKYKPAELADDEVPYHPHWDMIFDHIGHELTPVLRELPGPSRRISGPGPTICELGRLRLPRPLPAAPVPLLLWPGRQRQEHLLRVPATAGDKRRGQGRTVAHQRIQRRAIRGGHLRGGGDGRFQATRSTTPTSRSGQQAGPSTDPQNATG